MRPEVDAVSDRAARLDGQRRIVYRAFSCALTALATMVESPTFFRHGSGSSFPFLHSCSAFVLKIPVPVDMPENVPVFLEGFRFVAEITLILLRFLDPKLVDAIDHFPRLRLGPRITLRV